MTIVKKNSHCGISNFNDMARLHEIAGADLEFERKYCKLCG